MTARATASEVAEMWVSLESLEAQLQARRAKPHADIAADLDKLEVEIARIRAVLEADRTARAQEDSRAGDG